MTLTLLTLPVEIRQMIWAEVFNSSSNIVTPLAWIDAYFAKQQNALSRTRPRVLLTTHVNYTSPLESDSDKYTVTQNEGAIYFISTSLLRVNKSIAAEAKAQLFNNSVFYFHEPMRMYNFCKDIPGSAMQVLKHVAISFNRFQNQTEFFASVMKRLDRRTKKYYQRDTEIFGRRTLQSVEIIIHESDLQWLSQRSRRLEQPDILRHQKAICLPFFNDICESVEISAMALDDVQRSIRIVDHWGTCDRNALVAEIRAGETRLAESVWELSQVWGGPLYEGNRVVWESFSEHLVQLADVFEAH